MRFDRFKKIFAEFNFCDWLLHLLDFYFRLTPNTFLKELIFARKASTYFLKFLRKILNYFVKFKFSEFRKKDILPVVAIFVLDLTKASIECSPEKNLHEIKKCGKMRGMPRLILTFFIFLISTSILPSKEPCHQRI